ncbi:MAG: hypothetical protein ACREFS_09120, partial [Acetobacteraceae bacterium]
MLFVGLGLMLEVRGTAPWYVTIGRASEPPLAAVYGVETVPEAVAPGMAGVPGLAALAAAAPASSRLA